MSRNKCQVTGEVAPLCSRAGFGAGGLSLLMQGNTGHSGGYYPDRR
jgi:hypothetical protein